MCCVFSKMVWSGNLKKEFWLISGCCETAAILDMTEKLRIKNCVCMCGCVYVFVL